MKTNIQTIRENLNLTQKTVSSDLGLTQQAFSRYERGEREPDLETLMKLADYFQVSVDYLIGHDCKNITDRPVSSLAETDNYFANFEKLFKIMNDLQKMYVLGMVVGYLESVGINTKNILNN